MRTLALICALVIGASSGLTGQGERRWGTRLAEGFTQLTAGRVDAASAIFDEVAAAARGAGDGRSLAEARRGQGRVMAARRDTAGMAAAYQDALAMFESAGDLKGVGQVRSDMAFAAWQRADFDAVRDDYTKAAAAFEQAGLKSDQANAFRNMTFGRMPAAEKRALLDRALGLVHGGGDPRLEGLILHARGDVVSGIGEQQAALDDYDAALPLLEAANDPPALARLLTSLGRLHRIHGDAERALPYYQRTIALAAADQDAIRQAEDALSIALNALGRDGEALVHAERALAIAEQIRPALVPAQRLRVAEAALRNGEIERALALFQPEQVSERAQARRLMGRATAFRMKGDLAAAGVEVNRAIDLIAATPALDWTMKVTALYERSSVHEAADRLADATADAVQAVTIISAIRGSLVISDDFRAAFSDGYRAFFDRAVDLLSRRQRHEEAFQIAESGRARALRELRAARAVDTAEAQAPARSPSVAITTPADSPVLAYWVTSNASYAWVLDQNRIARSARLPIGRRDLAALVARAQSAPGAGAPIVTRGQAAAVFDHDPRPTLRELHARVFAPVLDTLPRNGRLLVIGDGPLLGLSFAELINPAGRYVIEDYTVRYAPSIEPLARIDRDTAPASALVVSLASGYPRANGVALPPLPGVRRESDALARVLSAGPTTRLIDAESTEANVRAAIAGRRVIHFATHAVVSNRNPEESFLALRPGGSGDGRLTAREILDLSIDADLVVLSACRGAAGQVTGEGMLGLSRAWLAAGSRALLASVRELPDEAAATILPRFYHSWQASGDAASALRVAQLEQLKRLRAGQVKVRTPFGQVMVPEHPSMWAGLILIGQP